MSALHVYEKWACPERGLPTSHRVNRSHETYASAFPPNRLLRFAVPAGEDFGAHPKELSQLRSGQPKHGPQCKFLPRQHAQVAYEEGSFILGALRLRCECVHPCAATLLTSQGEGSVASGSRGQQVGLPSEASTSVQPAGGDAGCRTLQGAAAPQLACRHLLYGSGTHIQRRYRRTRLRLMARCEHVAVLCRKGTGETLTWRSALAGACTAAAVFISK